MRAFQVLTASLAFLAIALLTGCENADGHDGPSQAEFNDLKQDVADLESTVASISGPVTLTSSSDGGSGKGQQKTTAATLPELRCSHLSHLPASKPSFAAHSFDCAGDSGYLANFPRTAGGLDSTAINSLDGDQVVGNDEALYYEQAGCSGQAYVNRTFVSDYGAANGFVFRIDSRDANGAVKYADPDAYWYVEAGASNTSIDALSRKNEVGVCESVTTGFTAYPATQMGPGPAADDTSDVTCADGNEPNLRTGFCAGKYAGPVRLTQ